jgi:hypothetical protein
VGKVRDILYQFFIPVTLQFIEKQSKNNGNRKTDKKAVKIDTESIPENPAKIKRVKKAKEMLHSHKTAAKETAGRHVIPKGYLNAVHRGITKYDIPKYREKHHQIEIPITSEEACFFPEPWHL